MAEERFDVNACLRCDCASVENQTCDKCAVRGYVADALASLTAECAAMRRTEQEAIDFQVRSFKDMVLEAIDGERLHDDTGEPEDLAYNRAIADVRAVVEMVLSRDHSDSTETGAPEG